MDDEDLIRELALEMLSSMGCQVHVEADGQAAVDYYRQHWQNLDIVILVLIVPLLSGKDTFYAIRTTNPEARILIANDFSAEGAMGQLLLDGARGLLLKPFQQREHIASLLKALEDDPVSADEGQADKTEL